MSKPNYSIRIDKDLMDKAKENNLKIGPLVEAAIAKALVDNKCPYCKQSMNKSRFKVVERKGITL